MSDSGERELAARLLIRVDGGAYSSRLLAGPVGAGVRTRVLGVLRWRRLLDEALGRSLSRPLDRLDAEVRATLRIGLHDGALLGVPAAVATDVAVRLVRRLGKASASGLVNAVLRRSLAGWDSVVEAASPDLKLSHPAWLFDRWLASFGADAAVAAMEAAQTPAPLWVWWLSEEDRSAAVDGGVELRPHPWCEGAWSPEGAPSELLKAVAARGAYVQDPSSQLVAHVARHVGGGRPRMADLCAAPGGKTALWRRLGGPVPVALDLRIGRLRLMRSLLRRAGGARLVAGDAARPPLAPGSLDLVLVDAPCSGTGTLRRHPDLRWRLQPESIDELAAVQRGILAGARELAAPGGVVLYTTCSVEPEENEGLVEPAPSGFERVDLEPALPGGLPWISTSAGGVRILPHEHGDGFTMHALRRI